MIGPKLDAYCLLHFETRYLPKKDLALDIDIKKGTMTLSRCLNFIFIASLFVLQFSCSSVFYHPTPIGKIDTSKLLIQPQSVSFVTEDGVKLHGWYFPAQGKTLGKIIQFHGNGQNLTNHFVFLRNAPFRGFDHFIFDYRGYGNSEGVPTPEGLIKDGRAALSWISKVKPDAPLVVMGQSLGGAVALKTLIDMKGEIPVKQIVIDSSFSSYRSVARDIMWNHAVTWILHPIAWLIVDNSEAPGGDIKKLSPTPILIVHGDRDQTVSYRFGEELYSLAAEPKDFWQIKDGEHIDFLFRKDWEDKFYIYLRDKLK